MLPNDAASRCRVWALTDGEVGVMQVQSWWIDAPGTGRLRDEILQPPGEGEVLVRSIASGISAGTERLIFRGEVPDSVVGLMRAPFQRGVFPGPLTYGYASVGKVIAGADALLGRTVFCLHPHQSHFVVPVEAAIPVPKNVPADRAILTANMETALNATWDAAVTAEERVAVVGAGVVGALVAYVLRTSGHRPLLVDVKPERAELAGRLGLDFAQPDAIDGLFDVVFNASGSPDALAWALQRLDFEGRAVEMSWYGDREVSLPLGGTFHARRLKILSSQVGAIAPSMRHRIDHRGRTAMALEYLADERLDALIDREIAFADLPEFMRRMASEGEQVLCARVRYR